ncbi:MAG: hypothetical protein JXA30_19475 [Deltaproteobacteria bacterium]|nr:hypothetical protein [Deltaproteobacteria bacterium]
MKKVPKDRIAAMADEIRAYLESHPRQMDTLRGIVTWWWELERYRQTGLAVEKALERLLEEGIVRTRETGGEMLFCLMKDKEKDEESQ